MRYSTIVALYCTALQHGSSYFIYLVREYQYVIPDLLIDMEMPREPFLEIQFSVKPLEITRKLGVVMVGRYTEIMYHRLRNGMRHDIIDLVSAGFESPFGCLVFLAVRKLLPPPAYAFGAHRLVYRVCSAHCKKGLSFDGEKLPAHEMIDIIRDLVYSAAVPFLFGIAVQKIEILMVAVNKRDREGLFRQL